MEKTQAGLYGLYIRE